MDRFSVVCCGLGQEIEVRPGIVTKEKVDETRTRIRCKPIYSKIVTLFAEHNDLKFAVPGGLIGVGTKIDPTLCRADRLVGQVVGETGKLPEIYTELEINYFLLRRLLGVATGDKKQTKVEKLKKGELLMVNIGSTSTGGKVTSIKADLAKIALTSPSMHRDWREDCLVKTNRYPLAIGGMGHCTIGVYTGR